MSSMIDTTLMASKWDELSSFEVIDYRGFATLETQGRRMEHLRDDGDSDLELVSNESSELFSEFETYTDQDC